MDSEIRANVSNAYRRAVTREAGAVASGNARRIREARADVARYGRALRALGSDVRARDSVGRLREGR